MADNDDNDDVNKSKNTTPVNGVSSEFLEQGLSRIDDIVQDRQRRTKKEVYVSRKRAEDVRDVRALEKVQSMPLTREMNEIITKRKAQLNQRISKANTDLDRIELSQGQDYEDKLLSSVNRQFNRPSVNNQSQEYARSAAGQNAGRMLAFSYSPEQLEEKETRARLNITQLEKKAQGLVKRIADAGKSGDQEARVELEGTYRQLERNVKFLGTIEAGQRKQRAAGLDIQSTEERIYKRGAQFKAELKQNEIREDIASGKIKTDDQTLANLHKQESDLKRQFLAELDKFNNATGKAATEIRDNLNNLNEAIKENAEKTSEIEDARQGRPQRVSNLANNLNLLSSGFGAVGGAAQAILVDQRMQQMQNITGYAEFENLKYQTYKKANAGDVMSQLLMSGFKSDEGYGTELRAGQVLANAANVAGSAAQVTAGGIRIAHSGSQEFNPFSQAIGTAVNATQNLQGGIMDVIGGTAAGAVQVADSARGIKTGQADISGRYLSLQVRRALLAVGAEQLQGLRDFGVDMSTAAMSMGGTAGSAFLQRSFSKPNMVQLSGLEKMQNARISPEQMVQMSAFGAQEIGSTFNEEQIYAARGLERSGFGSMQTNMQRMASLASAGANNPDSSLKSVLEAAFSRSLEGSKVLNEMVEYTGAMASQSVGRQMGLDVTAESAQLLSAGVDPNAKNKEAALALAATSAEKMRQISTDTGSNYSAMAATARISKMTGLSGDEAILAQKIDDATLRKLKNLKPDQIKNEFFKLGIDVKEGKEAKTVNDLIKARLITNLQMGGAGIALGVDAEKLANKIMNKQKLTDEEQLLFNKATNFAGIAPGEQAYRTATAVYKEEPNTISKEKAGKALRGEAGDELMKTLDDMRTQGFKQLSAAALEATAGFKDATEALKALGLLAKESENAVDKGMEARAKEAAAKSAGSLGKDTVIFNESVNTFSLAVDKLVKMSDMSKGDNLQGSLNWMFDRKYTKLGKD